MRYCSSIRKPREDVGAKAVGSDLLGSGHYQNKVLNQDWIPSAIRISDERTYCPGRAIRMKGRYQIMQLIKGMHRGLEH